MLRTVYGTGRASSAPQQPRQLSGATTEPQLNAVEGLYLTHSGSGMRAPVAMQQLLSSPALVCCTGTDGATPLRVYGLSRFNSAVACADQFFEQVWAATFSAFTASSRSPCGMLDSPI